MAKLIGTIVHVGLMMPFWLMIVLGNIKPLTTLLLLGPPVTFLIYKPLDIDSSANAEAGTWKTFIGDNAFPTIFFALALAAFVGDILHVTEAFLNPSFDLGRSISEALEALACSSNVVSLLNMIGLVGLHSESDEVATLKMIGGDQSVEGSIAAKCMGLVHKINTFWEIGRTAREQAMRYLLTVPFYALIWLVLFTIGGLNSPLPEAEIRRMKSVVQQWYVRFLWLGYKKLFHLLLLLSAVTIIAYLWVLLLIGLPIVWYIEYFGNRILKITVALRAFVVSTDLAHQAETYRHVDEHDWDWQWYLMLPGLFSVLLPITMPLTLRILAGETYMEALVNTYNDRHAEAYFGALQEQAMSATNKFLWVTGLGSFTL